MKPHAPSQAGFFYPVVSIPAGHFERDLNGVMVLNVESVIQIADSMPFHVLPVTIGWRRKSSQKEGAVSTV